MTAFILERGDGAEPYTLPDDTRFSRGFSSEKRPPDGLDDHRVWMTLSLDPGDPWTKMQHQQLIKVRSQFRVGFSCDGSYLHFGESVVPWIVRAAVECVPSASGAQGGQHGHQRRLSWP